MKTKIILAVSVFLLTLVGIHGGAYWMNRALHSDQAIVVPVRTELRTERLELEARAQHDLTTYGWVNERREYAKIPLDRAFVYYLRSAGN